MDLLKEKVAIVTGSNRGIGKAIVEEYVKNSAIVYAICRQYGCIDDLANELNTIYPGTICPIYLDVTDDEASKKAFQSIYKKHKKIDILVNNAGVMHDALIGMISDKVIEDNFTVNVFSVIKLTQLASRFMVKNQSGSIINISSIIGTNGNSGQSVYSASKGAVVSFTKSAAKELAPKGIRVNAIAPGVIKTDLLAMTPEDLLQEKIKNIKMGRIGEPEEVASVSVFLGSNLSNYISGQVIGVDGCTVI